MKAIILSKKAYREQDEIIACLTPDGKVNLFARGIKTLKSKNRSACDIGNIVDIEFINDKQKNIKRATLIKRLDQGDLESSLLLLSFFEVLNQLKLDEKHFELVCFVLENMQETKVFEFILYTLLKICKIQGIVLVVDSCVCCSRTENIVGLSIKDGGFLCDICFNTHNKDQKVKNNDLKVLHYFSYYDNLQFKAKVQPQIVNFELIKMIFAYIEYHLEVRSLNMSILEKVKGENNG